MRFSPLNYKTQADAIEGARACGYTTIIRAKNCAAVFAISERYGFAVQAWLGNKATKPAHHYSFRERDTLSAYMARTITAQVAREAYKRTEEEKKSAARAALKASDHYTVGDVLYTSWGYDQTNVEWYQVTEVKAKSITVRPIAENCNDHGQPGGGLTAPRRNEYTGAESTRPLNHYGRATCPRFGHSMHKWEGRAVYTSSTH